MLRRQRTFFLTANQYEPVMLEYTGVSSGRLWFRFKRYDDATRFMIRYRTSQDGGTVWTEWGETAERGITTGTDGYTSFTYVAVAGLMYEVSVILTGDDKDPSPESNIVTVLYPNEPAQAPPVVEGFVFYIDGRPLPALKPVEIPSGVSAWAIWYRAFGDAEWIPYGVAQNIATWLTASFFVSGNSYQFIIAWYDATNRKLLSDISNVATITLPQADIDYLLPPKALSASYYGEYSTGYYNRIDVQRGDMRATSVSIEYKRSSVGQWVKFDDDYVFADHSITEDTKAYWIGILMGTEKPIAGEIWQYRLKNKADGLETSVYSDIFSVTMPSMLDKLPAPTIALQQSGYSVIIGIGAVADAVGYRIERRSTSESNWTVIQDSLSPSINSYTDSSTSYGNTYFFRVTALGDNVTYQNSDPTEQSITVTQSVTLPAPVIDSVAESGIGVVVEISNINAPNTDQVRLEMSENGGSWKQVASGYPASQSETTVSLTVAGEDILEGGTLQFRAYCTPAAMATENSPYSSIASITIDEREWLLKWDGTAWDYCTSVTGGWYSPNYMDGDTMHYGGITAQDLGGGVLRINGINGSGYWVTRNGLPLRSVGTNNPAYKQICMIGTLYKTQEGRDHWAHFGSAWSYTYAREWNLDEGHGRFVIAGSDTGRGLTGQVENPNPITCGGPYYAVRDGWHVYFSLDGGYADVKGIYAIKYPTS